MQNVGRELLLYENDIMVLHITKIFFQKAMEKLI